MDAKRVDEAVMESQWRDVARINAKNDRRMAELIAEGVAPADAYGEMIRRDFAAAVGRSGRQAPSKTT